MAEKKVLSKSNVLGPQDDVSLRIEKRAVAELAGRPWDSPQAFSAAMDKIIAEEEGKLGDKKQN